MNSKLSVLMALFAATVIFQFSFASTITLTGYCPTYALNSSVNYFEFNFTNYGNGTASNMNIEPAFSLLAHNSTIKQVPSVGPGSSYSEKFYVSNVPQGGSYAINLNVSYLQDGSNYETVFPCIVYFGSIYQGPLLETVSISNYTMYVNITNAAQNAVTTQIITAAPQGFSVKNGTRNVTIPGQSEQSFTFSLTAPNYNDASFPIVSVLSYYLNGTHYGTISRGYITFGSPQNITTTIKPKAPISFNTIVSWLVVAVIIIILVLIIVALLLKRRHKPPQEQMMAPPTQQVAQSVEKKDEPI